MRSLLIEFHRFNDLGTGSLRKGDPYLAAAAAQPVREFKMPLDQVDFLDLMRSLRYQPGAAPREESLQEISEVVTAILGACPLPDLESGEFPLQLDLVVNAAELAALPFEAVMDATGQPLLLCRERPIELTRRVRHDFAEQAVTWPARPRVLFAWASPPGVGAVPHQEHAEALRHALEPWLPVQEGAGNPPEVPSVLTTLAEVELTALTEACAASIDAKEGPFTHVHILAHGCPVGRAHRQRFGVALHGKNGDLEAVLPEAITEALAPLRGRTAVVTLATCDAASMLNAIVPEKSVAHDLHVSGFPVVVASQLPLSVPGSTLIVARFYGALLAGRDARVALHEARTALYEHRERTAHDWVSLVGYVRLPEGYAEHLKEVRLEAVLASLKTAQASGDDLVKRADGPAAAFDRVADLLRGRINDLEDFLNDPDKPKRAGVLEENLGLLGSAEKRLAELHFERGKRSGGDEGQQEMRDALTRSLDWYRQGFHHNLSHHWTGVQYLSLESILTGRIEDPTLWHAAVAAAEIAARRTGEYWAQGSLAELHLLAPLAGQSPRADAAKDALEDMTARVRSRAGADRFPLESTERQLRRYMSWWTTSNEFFPGRADLASDAQRLVEVLRTG